MEKCENVKMGTVPFSTFPRFHIPILDIGKELLEQSERINREGLHVSAGLYGYIKIIINEFLVVLLPRTKNLANLASERFTTYLLCQPSLI